VTFKKVTPLGNGEITVTAQKEGYQIAQTSISVKLAEFNITVSVSGGKIKTLRIIVKNTATNKAVTGAEIIFGGAMNQNFTTSKSGSVSARLKGTGQLRIQIFVFKKGYLNWDGIIIIPSRKLNSARRQIILSPFILQKTNSLCG